MCLPLSGAAAAKHSSKKSCEAIFSFGDLLSDPGNLIVDGIPNALTTARAAYGMTFFRRPTGCRSNHSAVVVDFLEILVPRFAVAFVAASTDGVEWVSLIKSASPAVEHLTGEGSVLGGVAAEVVQALLNVAPELVELLKGRRAASSN